jgi:predicted kinase
MLMLIILAGLPGSGKTTLAKALARRLGAVHVRVDTIEQNIRNTGVEVGPAGYMVAYGVAEDNLALGHIVVADSVNSLTITRRAWRAVAERQGVPASEIWVKCSDKVEHRHRVETRVSDVPGLIKPSWTSTEARIFEDWETEPLVVDTAGRSPEQTVVDLISALQIDQDFIAAQEEQ